MDWNLRTCSRRGHVTYAPDETDARNKVHATAADGTDLWQCLRCATFVPAAAGRPETGPVAQVPLVPRGRELKDLLVMRLLSAERLGRGLLMALLALGAWKFHSSQATLREKFESTLPHAKPLASWLGVDLNHAHLVQLAEQLLNVSPHTVVLAAAGLLGYGILQVAEGVGLWLGKRWGEYVSVVGTSAGLPLEVHELIDGASVVKIVLTAVNIAAIVWLVVNGRLFGVRGGHHAYVAARRSDAVLDPAAFAATDAEREEIVDEVDHEPGSGDIDDRSPRHHEVDLERAEKP